MRLYPIADVVKIVSELLPGNGCAVGPVFLAGDDLAERVVLIDPKTVVGVGRGGSLIRLIIGIVERRQRRGAVADTRGGCAPREYQTIEVIVLFRCCHHGPAVVLEGNLAHQRRVRNAKQISVNAQDPFT